MSNIEITTGNRSDAYAAVLAHARTLRDAHGRVCVLVPSRRAVHDCNVLALGDTLAVEVMTTLDWIADRWELYGDGRRLVSATQRNVALAALAGGASLGRIRLIAGLASGFLPAFEGGAWREREPMLAQGEREVCELLESYAAQLRGRGLIEACQAAAFLAGTPAVERAFVWLVSDVEQRYEAELRAAIGVRGDVVCVRDTCLAGFGREGEAAELDAILGRLPLAGRQRQAAAAGESAAVQVSSTEATTSAQVPSAEATAVAQALPVEARGALRVLAPSGRYAVPRAVLDAVTAAYADLVARGIEEPSIVVACKNPQALCERLMQPLSQAGITSSVASWTPVADTGFGAGFVAFLSLATCPDAPVEAVMTGASDFAFSPASGLRAATARNLDTAWRQTRTTSSASVVADLASASESFAAALEAARNGSLADAIPILAARATQALRANGSQVRTVEAVASRVVEVLEEAAQVQLPAAAACALAAEAFVPLRASTGGGVAFTTLAAAAEGASASCDVLVVCDLTSAAYPARQRDGADIRLLAKLGIDAATDAIETQRRQFSHALATARHRVWVGRELADADAVPTYPAMVLEELFDTYLADPTSDDGTDANTGVPFALTPWVAAVGEDDVVANELLGAAASGREWDRGEHGIVRPEHRPFIVAGTVVGSWSNSASAVLAAPPQGGPAPAVSTASATSVIDTGSAAVTLSPSALEDYLACPYRWFTNRRIRISSVDAGFGALEMGNVAHDVMRTFYETWREQGGTRVTPESLAAATELMHRVFADVMEKQAGNRISYDPLIPRTELEQHQIGQLEAQLVDFLRRDAVFLPGFAPTHIEHRIKGDVVDTYAGFLLTGQIDRIDVNERGEAVIVDYKGSLSNDYALASSSALEGSDVILPHRIQTLAYAQMARRIFGYTIVGALYVPYGRSSTVFGAYDPLVIGPSDIGRIAPAKCSVAEVPEYGGLAFHDLLDVVEERIGIGIQPLLEGHIAPSPRGAHPCRYCPVAVCERRQV